MFKCVPGNHVSNLGDKMIRKVTATKETIHPERTQVFRGKLIVDKGGKGSRVVTEVAACSLHSF